MNNKFLLLSFILLMAVGLNAQNSNAVSLVKEAANQKALSFLNLIPEGSEKEYGFNNRSDFSRAKIGEPYQTYYVAYQENKLVLTPGNEWRVPIAIDGYNVALLTVQIISEKAEVVNFGANVLAKKIQEFEQLHANESSDRILIRNTFLRSDYIATNLSSISNSSEKKSFEFDSNSSQLVYRINAGEPEKISVASFCKETISHIDNTSER